MAGDDAEPRFTHVNGSLVPDERACVSVRDRGFRYGDAAFETVRAYGGTLFEWARHLDRLERTCETLRMPDAMPADLERRVHETLGANGLEDAYVRVSITRGVQPGTLAPRPVTDPSIVVLVDELPRGGLRGTPVWDAPAVLDPVSRPRIPEVAVPASLKTHNYLNGVLARLDADPQADEALMSDLDGFVAEGTTSNVFFVADGTIRTPTVDGPVLPGITREIVLELADELDILVETGRYALDAIRSAEEVFVTNTTWEVRPVNRVGDVTYPVGSITASLDRAFRRRVERLY